jgi:hypothetical protein
MSTLVIMFLLERSFRLNNPQLPIDNFSSCHKFEVQTHNLAKSGEKHSDTVVVIIPIHTARIN